jgi:uncharacterized protein (DUF362 family)
MLSCLGAAGRLERCALATRGSQMKHRGMTRREFLKAGTAVALGAASASLLSSLGCSVPAGSGKAAVVSIARIKDDNVAYAVEEAIDLLGGIETVAAGKERIMLKPNLVAESPTFTTKPEVVKTLARLMKQSGKDVLIGEGSAAAGQFNVKGGETYRTRKQDLLDRMQAFIFERLGYTELARSMDVPLVNLHSGDMVEVPVPGGYAFDEISLHHALAEVDLLCSVPMMKTHTLATVTLGMKNLIGLYPGTVYYSVRSWVHEHAASAGSAGVAYEILDMVRANKLGLTVIDGSMAMEGNGPTDGDLVKMDVIIAGTNPLATDMVGASVMGFDPDKVPTFSLAHESGMGPGSIDEIEIRGAEISQVRQRFKRPEVVTWQSISKIWGVKEL